MLLFLGILQEVKVLCNGDITLHNILQGNIKLMLRIIIRSKINDYGYAKLTEKHSECSVLLLLFVLIFFMYVYTFVLFCLVFLCSWFVLECLLHFYPFP